MAAVSVALNWIVRQEQSIGEVAWNQQPTIWNRTSSYGTFIDSLDVPKHSINESR